MRILTNVSKAELDYLANQPTAKAMIDKVKNEGIYIPEAIIYSIVIHRWGDLFLYSLIFAGILAILMAVVVVQDFCSSMLEKISML